MVFSSISFLFLFLPIVFILYVLIPNIKIKNVFLTLASLVFYAWGEPVYVLLMLFSVFFNMIFGILVVRFSGKKRFFLGLAVLVNVGLLFYFKYFMFFLDTLNLIPFFAFEIPDIRLPIGISFFTFQAMSYVFDVYKGDAKPQKNYLNILLYISLFPQLIAGPIVKYRDVEEQINHRECTVDKVSAGIRRFIIGLSKKVLIANQMAIIVDELFALNPSELNVITAWIGAISYLFQIYFDFSGYSDMAIGLGKMFGFEFKENFNYPITASGIKDFWRKWHISLSTWFKEYLYIPLGGNRKGKARTYVNQFIVFITTGLWHGANLTFVLWGVLHGVFLFLETVGIIPINKIKNSVIKHVYTVVVVTTLFVIFRADTITYAFDYLHSMFFGFDFNTQSFAIVFKLINNYVVFILIIAVVASTNAVKKLNFHSKVMAFADPFSYVSTLAMFALCVLSLASNSYNPFIYFRF